MVKTLLRPWRAEITAKRPMRLLAAEDSRANQMVLQAYLGLLPLDLVFAQTGREALRYWQAFAPDLILMDISMPEMAGDEAARSLRAAESAGLAPAGGPRKTPIIALTAHSADHHSIGPEFSDHLQKPLERGRLMALLARYCPKGAYFQEKL